MIAEREKRKLLIPEWGGELTDEEVAYIKSSIKGSRALRIAWGFIRGRGYRPSDDAIRERAMFGAPARRTGKSFTGVVNAEEVKI